MQNFFYISLYLSFQGERPWPLIGHRLKIGGSMKPLGHFSASLFYCILFKSNVCIGLMKQVLSITRSGHWETDIDGIK